MTTFWFNQKATPPSDEASIEAHKRQLELTKPPGSLGRLEQLAITLASHQGVDRPTIEAIHISIFAADHGIAAKGVSAFPQAVTQQMIHNFSNGGAAINALATYNNCKLEVINLGTVSPLPELPKVLDSTISAGTKDFSVSPAMTASECLQALEQGRQAIERCDEDCCLFIGGEMGIGNTSSASALSSTLLPLDLSETTGLGTGLNTAGLANKIELIGRSIERAKREAQDITFENQSDQALFYLRQLGGFEIAALAGAFIAAAQAGISILVDGFICTAAALVACQINPGVRAWLIASHQSEELGHKKLLAALNLKALLSLNMRLGEASGAALCIPLLQQACALHNNMSTFAEAGVSQ